MSAPLRCRPDRSYWFFVAFVGAIGVLALSPLWLMSPAYLRDSGLGIFLTGSSACLLAGTAVGAVWLQRVEIVADEWGLKWRSLSGWRSAAWEEVLDYFDRPPGTREHDPPPTYVSAARVQPIVLRAVVQTKAGSLGFGPDWLNYEALRETIANHAGHLSPHGWRIEGVPPLRSPIRFEYSSRLAYWLMIGFGIIAVLWLLWFASRVAVNWSIPEAAWAERFGPDRTAAAKGMVWGFIGSILAMAVAYAWWIHRWFRFARHRFTAATSGLGFDDGVRESFIPWAEVTEYYRHPRMFRGYVVCAGPRTIEFPYELPRLALLKRIVQGHALNARTREWRLPDTPLGGEASLWTGLFSGAGSRVYHDQTRGNHSYFMTLAVSCAWLMIGIALVFPIGWLKSPPGTPLNIPALVAVGVVSALGAVAISLGWLIAWRTRVLADEHGITIEGPFGKRSLDWRQIESYGIHPKLGMAILRDAKTRLFFWPGLCNFEELKAEIARRAVNSSTREWEPPQPGTASPEQ
jgi:hypothetical protein